MRKRIFVWCMALGTVAAVACESGGPVGNNGDCLTRIGPAGGTACLGTQASATIPAGALSSTITVGITAVATPGDLVTDGAIGQAFRFDPIGQTFATPVRIAINVPAAALGGRPLSDVTLRRSTTVVTGLTPAGEELTGIQRSADGTVSGLTSRFGVFSAVLPPLNQNPTANAGADQNVTVGATVNLAGSGTDPDNDQLGFSWAFVSRPAGSNAALNNANSQNASFVADVAGNYDVRLTVSDNRGGTATDDVRIVAAPAAPGNRAPIANAGPDQSATTGVLVTLNGTGSSDPDGDPITLFAWTFVSRPAGSNATMNNAASATASFTADVPGTYVVQLVVGDGQLLSPPDTAVITVTQQNRAPTLNVNAPDAVFVNTEVTIVANVNDPDGDSVTVDFAFTEKPAGAGGLTDLGAEARFTGNVPGLYRIRVTASDNRGGTAEAEVDVAVNVNVPGNYSVNLFVDATACGQGTGSTAGTLPVLQPTPGSVILDLPTASNQFVDQAAGTLVGEEFNFSGTIRLKSGDQTIPANGAISGTIRANGQMNLAFNFNVIICNVNGTITGTKS
jgi:hypothetical protein